MWIMYLICNVSIICKTIPKSGKRVYKRILQSNSRVKQLKRQIEETEDELSKEKMQRRKAQREVEDMMEAQESQSREISSLKTKLR